MPAFLCALPFVPGQAAAYIMGVRKGRGAYVSERRRMLDTGRLCGGAGGRILIAAIFPVGALMFLVAVLLIACGCACCRR